MIERKLSDHLKKTFKKYPIVTLTGPRQSGKTTLCQHIYPLKPYVNLEDPRLRDFALTDPVAFLAQYPDGAILDEIQRTPLIPSYLQAHIDQEKLNGLFILTGSQNFQVMNATGQSLAGRTAVLTLLPLSLAELAPVVNEMSVEDLMFKGFYPRVYDQNLDPQTAYQSYVMTYVERDVRLIENIKNLSLFQKFLMLCAGRIGQPLNLSNLSNDLGVSSTTLNHWLSVLEASYIVYLLKPFHSTLVKRLTKAPKLYFYDVGLASYLLGIESAKQLVTHPLRGWLFENMVVIDYLKKRLNAGLSDNLFFFRDYQDNEVDLIQVFADGYDVIEIKMAQTYHADFKKGIEYFAKWHGKNIKNRMIIYAGNEEQRRSDVTVVSFRKMA